MNGLKLAPIRQQIAVERLEDVTGAVRKELRALPLEARVRSNMRIAVAVGSRGIARIGEIVKVVLGELNALGAKPFLVPAMGSHGGGTAAKQREVLEGYGLSEDAVGVPILSSMETLQIGETDGGMPVYTDVNAASADGIILVNRVKEHTSFRGAYESGLMKMMVVGLGKARGAAEAHNWGIRDAIPAAGRVLLEKLPVLAGVAIVENGYHEPVRIAVLPAECFAEDEPKLLELARRLAPRIPAELFPLDMLILQEIGKDISGTGMDLNGVGMWRRNGGPIEPPISVLAVLDLTANSHGNAIGVGHADLITERLRAKIDPHAMYTNALSSHNWGGGKIPITLPTDRDMLNAGLAGVVPERARVMLLRNTLELHTLWVSEPLLAVVPGAAHLEQIGPAKPLAFDAEGALIAPEVG